MKKHFFMLAAASCLALTSCSSDDDSTSNGGGNVDSKLVGTYQLTSLVAPTNQDYDGDGDNSSNLALEGNCYSSSWISFHSDGTYDQSFTSSTMGTGGISLDCDTKVTSGTYTENGNTITTTETSGSANVNATYTFNATAHTLTRTQANASYAGWNALTSIWANLTGNLNLTFTKYTDNDNDNGQNADDTDHNNNNTANADLLGQFDLTAFVVGTAQDLDKDGQSSTNLVNEIDCYTSSKIEFNNDGTFERTTAVSSVGNLGLSLECTTSTSYGRWTRNGNTVTTTQTTAGVNVSTQYTFNTTAKTLTASDATAQYPVFSLVTSLFANVTGQVNYTFTKDNN